MIALLIALSCPTPVMQNVSKEPWNDYDRSMLAQTEKRCGEIYPTAPCVKLFRKYNRKQYSVICGKKK